MNDPIGLSGEHSMWDLNYACTRGDPRIAIFGVSLSDVSSFF